MVHRGVPLTPLFLVSSDEVPLSSATFVVMSVGAKLTSRVLFMPSTGAFTPKSSLPGGILILLFIKELAPFPPDVAPVFLCCIGAFICPAAVVLAKERLVAIEGVGLPSLSFLIFLMLSTCSSSSFPSLSMSISCSVTSSSARKPPAVRRGLF